MFFKNLNEITKQTIYRNGTLSKKGFSTKMDYL